MATIRKNITVEYPPVHAPFTLNEPVVTTQQILAQAAVVAAAELTIQAPTLPPQMKITADLLANETSLHEPTIVYAWVETPSVLAIEERVKVPSISGFSDHGWNRGAGQIVFDEEGQHVDDTLFIDKITVATSAAGTVKLVEAGDKVVIECTTSSGQLDITRSLDKRRPWHGLRVAAKPAGKIFVNLA